MIVRAIIVDDEPLARKLIANLLESVSEVQVIGSFGTGKEAIHAIDILNPDILFLDIQLKDMNGFSILEKIKIEPPLTIFITAFDFYAIEAFNVFAFDYLLKPFTKERFYKSLKRALETFKTGKTTDFQDTISQLLKHVNTITKTTNENIKRISIPHRNKIMFVDTDDITYVLASNYYIEIYTIKAKYVLRKTMKNIIDELDTDKFVRIHRSSIINMSCIDELITFDYGEINVKMYDSKKLRVSKGYRKEFLIKMGVRK